MAPLIPPKAAHERARAAWAFSLLNQDELAERAGIHHDTLRKMLGRKPTEKSWPLEDLYKIADACAVPRAFMDDGFSRLETNPVEELRGELSALRDRVDELQAEVQVLDAEALRRNDEGGAASPGPDPRGPLR
jgi:uncharacterized small protein (DUF1192 family)